MRFTTQEITKLGASLLVLAFGFSFQTLLSPTKSFAAEFGASLFLLFLAFGLHEIAHKVSAQTWELSAEFDLWSVSGIPIGLILALATSVASLGRFIFPLLGAVVIAEPLRLRRKLEPYPEIREELYLEISYAGVLVNIIISVIFAALFFVLPPTGVKYSIVRRGCSLNASLAFFNLLPFAMLDGNKIYQLNRSVWIRFFLVSIIALLISVLLYLL